MENTEKPADTVGAVNTEARDAAIAAAIAQETAQAGTVPETPQTVVAEQPATNPAPKQISMYRWRNGSTTQLVIAEGMIMVPAGGYTPPMMTPTPSLKALEDAGLMIREAATVMPAGDIKALTAGQTANDVPTGGSVKPVFASPYMPIASQSGADKLKIYADPSNPGAAKMREAINSCVVSVGEGTDAAISVGEMDPEKASKMLKISKTQFTTEVSVGDYVADEAEKTIKAARQMGVVAPKPGPAGEIPPGAPADTHQFFTKTHLQKKIAIFQSTDAGYLKHIKAYEKDNTVASCITQRLGELGVAD